MSWVIRGDRGFEYRSVRRSGRVTSRYLGGGIPAESALFFAQLEAGRRAERAAKRAEWEAERAQLADVERGFIETDAAYRELAEAALLATGHHRPSRGRWRKRRTMATDIKASPADPPLVTGPEMSDLLDRIDRAEGDEKQNLRDHLRRGTELLLKYAKLGDERTLPALRAVLSRRPDYFGRIGFVDFAVKAAAMAAAGPKDVLVRDLFTREIEATAARLAGPDASPLEVLLCQRVALAHFDNLHIDTLSYEADLNGCSLEKAEFLSRQRNRATARFLSAARSLATVRRLALPVLQLTIADASSRAVQPITGPADVPAPTLRLRDGS